MMEQQQEVPPTMPEFLVGVRAKDGSLQKYLTTESATALEAREFTAAAIPDAQAVLVRVK